MFHEYFVTFGKNLSSYYQNCIPRDRGKFFEENFLKKKTFFVLSGMGTKNYGLLAKQFWQGCRKLHFIFAVASE